MLFSIVSFAAVAGHAVVADGVRKPYMPEVARMSVRNILLGRRQDDGGYQPDTTLCGTGTSCAEACGAGFAQCSSTDGAVYCYDAGNSQTCCPNGSGNSCDAGYYCSVDTAGTTYCCPNDTSVDDCAATFNVTGVLSSQISVATSTSSAVDISTYSTVPVLTSTSTSSVVSSTSSLATATSTSEGCTTYTSEEVFTFSVSGTTSYTAGYNATVIKTTGSVPTSSTPAYITSPVQAEASTLHFSKLVVVAAIALVAFV
jgi:hypothetical protein